MPSASPSKISFDVLFTFDFSLLPYLMRLLHLTLETFRNYEKLDLSFEEEQNTFVLVGENASGKTNVLEAISVLALLASPRRVDDEGLMTWERTHYRVSGRCRSDTGEERTFEVISQLEPRRARASLVNGVRTPHAEYIGKLPVVTFLPDDLLLWNGSPSGRRRMIDALLCQVSVSYLQAHVAYERSLRQRNTLLKRIRDGEQTPSSLEPWNEKLATLGAMITQGRLELFGTMQETILRELTMLGGKPKQATFHYVRKGTGSDEATIREDLLSFLRASQERDILTATTGVGPHRDDFTLAVDNHDLASSASRGEQRAALLALLLLQASFLTLRTGERPLLLLDDIFSEFDAAHRSAVLERLADHQVIMTAVELEKKLATGASLLHCPLLKIPSSTSAPSRIPA